MKLELKRQPFAGVFFTFALLLGVMMLRLVNAPYTCEVNAVSDLPTGMLLDSLTISTALRNVITILFLVVNSVLMMRITIRYRINGTHNYTALPLYLVGGYAMFIPYMSISGLLASSMLIITGEQMIGSFKRTNRFGSVYGAMFCMGVLLLLHTSFSVLLLLVPVMFLLFERTMREAIIGVTGLATPLLFCMFGWWVGGESSLYIFYVYYSAIITPSDLNALQAILTAGFPIKIFICTLFILIIYCICISIRLLPRMRTRARRVHIFSFAMLACVVLMPLLPSSNIFLFGLFGFPFSQLGSSALTNNSRWWSIIIYVIIILSAIWLNFSTY